MGKGFKDGKGKFHPTHSEKDISIKKQELAILNDLDSMLKEQNSGLDRDGKLLQQKLRKELK